MLTVFARPPTRHHATRRLKRIMPLLRSRTALHRARFSAAVALFAWLAVALALFLVLVAIAYLWNNM